MLFKKIVSGIMLTLLLTGALAFTRVNFVKGGPAVELSYDDGGFEVGISQHDSKFAVNFSLPAEWPDAKLLAARFYMYSDSGLVFRVHVYDSNGTTDLMTPIDVTPLAEGWYDVDLSGLNVIVPQNFMIAKEGILPDNMVPPYIGFDTSGPISLCSFVWFPWDPRWITISDGNLGIRAVVASPVVDVHDVAVVDVKPFKTVVGQNFTTVIMVTVENQGNFTETFNVTAYYDGNPFITEQWLDPAQSGIFWSMGDAIRDGYIDYWDIALISASIGWWGPPGENPADIDSNGQVDGIDLWICCKNFGKNIWESLGISKIIRDYANVTLPSGYCAIVGFRWNTTGFAKGNYTISAYAEPVLNETDTLDNTFTDGWVMIAIVGDITGSNGYADGKVDMFDLWEEARHFGIDHPDPRYKPNFDIDDNLKIDMMDLWLTAREFGKIDP